MDRIQNESIRGTAHFRCPRLRWFGQLQRRDGEGISRNTLLRLVSDRTRGRPKRRFLDVVKEDVKLVVVREDDGEDGARWR